MATYTNGQIFFRQADVVPPGQTSTVQARAMRSLDGVVFVEVQYYPTEQWSAKPAGWLLGSGFTGSIDGLAGQDIFDLYQVPQSGSVEGKLFKIPPGNYQNNVVVGPTPYLTPTPATPAVVAATLALTNPITTNLSPVVTTTPKQKVANRVRLGIAILGIPVCLLILFLPKFRKTVFFWIALVVLVVDVIILGIGLFAKKVLE